MKWQLGGAIMCICGRRPLQLLDKLDMFLDYVRKQHNLLNDRMVNMLLDDRLLNIKHIGFVRLKLENNIDRNKFSIE